MKNVYDKFMTVLGLLLMAVFVLSIIFTVGFLIFKNWTAVSVVSLMLLAVLVMGEAITKGLNWLDFKLTECMRGEDTDDG